MGSAASNSKDQEFQRVSSMMPGTPNQPTTPQQNLDQKELEKRNHEIDQQLAKDRQADKRRLKILLLGPSLVL